MRRFAPFALAALSGVTLGLGAYTFVYARGYSYFSNDPEACANCHVMREFRDIDGLERGAELKVTQFAIGDKVDVTGTSKGKGFQGVVRRHHFHGHPSTHGHKDQQRMPGSIGAGGVQHVMKGRRMAGQMGDETVTVKNLKVVEVRDGGILAIKGAVPGPRNSIIEIRTV